MKLIKVVFLILICIFYIKANPIIEKDISISEFWILNDSTWALEVYFFDLFHGYIDSSEYHLMTLSSSFGEANVKPEVLKDSLQYLLITPDSLITPLKINPKGDSLVITTFDVYGNETYRSLLKFGDKSHASIYAPKPWQSICSVYEFFSTVYCLDNSPTLGYENDYTGIYAKIKGQIFDKNGYPIPNAEFYIYDHYFMSDSLGFYQVDLLARPYNLTKILIRTAGNECYSTYAIDTLFLKLVPDTLVEKDIHLKIYTTLEKQPVKIPNSIIFYNYPNPFNPGTYFFIDGPLNKNLNNAKIEIFNVNGKLLRVLYLNGEKKIYWDGKDFKGKMQPSGKYFYRLIVKGNVLKTGSTILLR